MDISLSRNDLLSVIQKTQGAVNTKNTLPILNNVLLEADNNSLKITATDLDIAVSSTIPCKVKTAGSITIPSKRFFEIIRELRSDHDVQILVQKLTSIEIRCGKSYFKLVGIPKDDFPQIPDFNDEGSISLPQHLLAQMIRLTSFAMSRDDARYVLNGLLFSFKGKVLRLVATDGRRLALIDRDLDTEIKEEKDVIVPMKAIQELNRNLEDQGEILISLKSNQIQFKIENTKITSRLIEGEFPNYEQVIPKKSKEQLVLDTQEFLQATKRASIFTNQESQSIKIDLSKNRMVISKNTPDVGELREEIEADYKGSEFSIGFNPNYLIDVLKNIKDETVCFELSNPEKPGMIRIRDNYTYIVLPMQLT